MSEPVRLLIHARDGSGEGLWATRTVAPGIFELDNFPISDVDYTLGDLVMAADDGDAHLYITGLAEWGPHAMLRHRMGTQRRFRGVTLRCEATDDAGPEASARHRAIAQHLQATGVRVEGLLPGWIGAAVPVGLAEQAFAALLASAPYPIHPATEEDAAAP